MSLKRPKKSRERWWKAGFGCIAETLQERLDRDAALWTRDKSKKLMDDEKDHIKWRLGYNLYKAGRFMDAIDYLTLCAAGGDCGKKEAASRKKRRLTTEAGNNTVELKELDELDENKPIEDNRYQVHQTAARCCVELFLETHLHYHLEAAYRHFTMAIERMPAGLIAMFQLPPLLYEFAILLEYHGAFESALEMYSKILTKFPTWRGYFDAMYRCAMVGRHVAELKKDIKIKDSILNKSIDMLQFLLEAVPNSIKETHIIVLYGRAMEISSDPNLRYRSTGIYQSLYDYLRTLKAGQGNNCGARKFDTFKELNA